MAEKKAPPSLPGEEWLDVVGYEGFYMVSNLGRVWSVRRRITRKDGVVTTVGGRVLRTIVTNKGYATVSMGDTRARVHRLVAAAFLGDRPVGLFVNHIDGDKLNNRPQNLEYVTPKENTAHAIRMGLFDPGRKLSNEQIRTARHALSGGRTQASLARELGVSQTTICKINLGLLKETR